MLTLMVLQYNIALEERGDSTKLLVEQSSRFLNGEL